MKDIDERIKTLLLNSNDDKDEDQPDSFAKRAEFYYQQRPQLLSLLHDLYNTYLCLADRNSKSLRRVSEPHSSVSSFHLKSTSLSDCCLSDAESSLSFQLPSSSADHQNRDNEGIIAEIVVRNVEYDLMVHELGLRERQVHESSRKIELQRSLLDVLESERLVLLNENAGLKYKVSALIEENQDLVSECLFMKRKAGELAECVMKMRDDHRVFMISEKIEDLHGKIYRLEKRENTYGTCNQVKCFQEINQRVCLKKKEKKLSKWWRKVMDLDLLFLCKPQ